MIAVRPLSFSSVDLSNLALTSLSPRYWNQMHIKNTYSDALTPPKKTAVPSSKSGSDEFTFSGAGPVPVATEVTDSVKWLVDLSIIAL